MMEPLPPPLYKKSNAKVLTKAILSLLAVSAIGISAMPILCSTKKGTKMVCRYVGKKMGGTLQIESLSLSWLSGQSIEGLSFQDDGSALFASCRMISSDASLVSILFQNNLGDMLIDAPHLKLKKDTLSFLTSPSVEMKKASLLYLPVLTPKVKDLLFPLTGRITLKEGRIDLATKNTDPMSIFDMKGFIFFAADESVVSTHLTGSSKAQQKIGSIDIEGTLKDINSFTPDLTLSATIDNLPVKVIDQTAALFAPAMRGSLPALIGDSLSSKIDCHLSQGMVDMQLEASSQNLNLQLSTAVKEGYIILTRPASFSFQLSHEALKDLQIDVSSFASGANLSGSIDMLRIPTTQTGIAFDKLALSLSASVAPIGVDGAAKSSMGPLQCSVKTEGLDKTLTFSLAWPILPSTPTASLTIHGSVTAPLSDHRKISAELSAKELPTELLDAALKSPMPSAALGKALDIHLLAHLEEKATQMTLSVKSDNLSIPKAIFGRSDALRLLEPFTCTFMPSDSVYALLFGEGTVKSAPSHPLQLNIDHLELPSLERLQDISISASLQSSLIGFSRLYLFSDYQIQNLSCQLSIETLKKIKVSGTSSLFSFSTQASYEPISGMIAMQQPMQLQYLITDAQLQSLIGSKTRPYLTAPTSLSCSIDPLSVSWKRPLMPQLNISAVLECPDIDLQDKEGAMRLSLQQMKLGVKIAGKEGSLSADAKAMIQAETQPPAPLSVSLDIKAPMSANGFDISAAAISTDLDIQNIPLSAVGAFFSQGDILSNVLGPSLTLRSHVEKHKSTYDISFSGNSKRLSAEGSITYKDNVLSLKQSSANVTFTLTRQAQQMLDALLTKEKNPPQLLLGQDATVQIALSQLQLPFITTKDHSSIAWKDSVFAAKVSCFETSLQDKESAEMILLKNTQLSVEKKAGPSDIKASLMAEASTSTAKASQSSGVLTMAASISDIYGEDMGLYLDRPSVKLDMKIQKMPSSVFDMLLRIAHNSSSPVAALFGPSVTASALMQVKEGSGPINLNINSSGARASIVGRLSSGTLTLTEPMHAQVMMTPPLSRLLLGEVNPLSISEIRSSNPITFEVQPAGVSIPLTSFSLAKLTIPDIRIELGQVQCSNEGNLNITLGLLKSVQLSQNKYLNLWFTPIDMHIKNGVIDMDRADILIAETFDICLWGKINPILDKVNMYLGLTADCLSKAFGISELPDDYVLQIPLTGSLKDVKINTGKATAKVAALLAWQQASRAGANAAGPAGGALGKLMNKLGSLPLNDSDTPKANRPFPWEAGSSDKKRKKKTSSSSEKKSHVKPTDKPLKQLWNVIR